MNVNGLEMHELAKRLWPLHRSLTGDGTRETLKIIAEHLPGLQVFELPSHSKVFDWTIPKEWRIREAWIQTPDGRTICSFNTNNLHVVGYSTPVDRWVDWQELNEHLYSLPDQPDAIPYITSYYAERWGFCITHKERETLPRQGQYRVKIDAELFDGSLSYGELLVPGQTDRQVLISTYVCHPSMANNELSGPVVSTHLALWAQALQQRKYTYRFVFLPETIGSVAYISKNLDTLQQKVDAGFNVSCVGDDRAYSYLPSRNGATLSDKAAQHVLKWLAPDFVKYEWRHRGSDERQYCAPGVDLPIASIMRSKYGQYPEYHTSLDDLVNVVTPQGLAGGFNALRLTLESLERNCRPRAKVLCEPQLGKRGLYPSLSTKDTAAQVRVMMDFLTWSDGAHDLYEIADLCDCPVWEIYKFVDLFVSHQLIDID